MRLSVLSYCARLALALALLVTWQAALQHPIEHVDELGEFVHPHNGHSHNDGQSDGSEAEPLCDALAALTACAPGATQAVAASEQFEHLLSPQHDAAPRVAEAPPFLSQGPPASV
jgi:hypothetical protein